MPKNFDYEHLSAEENAELNTAHLLKDHIFSLSMMCKEKNWHVSGLHLCAASDQLEQMLERGELTQPRPYELAEELEDA
jgi:hypothetical protein